MNFYYNSLYVLMSSFDKHNGKTYSSVNIGFHLEKSTKVLKLQEVLTWGLDYVKKCAVPLRSLSVCHLKF